MPALWYSPAMLLLLQIVHVASSRRGCLFCLPCFFLHDIFFFAACTAWYDLTPGFDKTVEMSFFFALNVTNPNPVTVTLTHPFLLTSQRPLMLCFFHENPAEGYQGNSQNQRPNVNTRAVSFSSSSQLVMILVAWSTSQLPDLLIYH